MNRIATFVLAAVLAAATLFTAPQSAQAGLMTSTDAPAQAAVFATDPMFQSMESMPAFSGLGEFFAGSGSTCFATAGHVLLDEGTTHHDAFEFSLNNNFFDVPTDLVMADASFVFPGHTEETSPGDGNDIGLIHLVDPIFDVIPAESFYGTAQPRTHVYTAGYRAPGVFPNTGTFDGVLRAVENGADCFGCSPLVNDNYWLADFSQFDPLPLEWQGSGGDSGGRPWFAETDDRMQLVGINDFSRGNSDFTGAIRVSLYNDWIDETIAANGGPTAVPEPSSFVLFAMAMLGLGCSRRFRQSFGSA